MHLDTVIADLTSARARKLWTAFGGIVALILAANILPEQYRVVGETILGLLTSFGVYTVPNKPATLGLHTASAPVMDKGTTIG